MSRFNQQATNRNVSDTTNLAGGKAFSQSPELELVSMLLTSFVQDQYYRSAEGGLQRLKELVQHMKSGDRLKFAAKAGIYARREFGMRSITHALAGELAPHLSGYSWAKDFYNQIIFRPDDMLEIASYYFNFMSKPANNKRKKADITGAMKKGFTLALGRYDKYALAKYRGNNKEVKLIDLVNLLHPAPTEKNKEAIEALVKGNLASFDTWETELTKAGQTGETEDEVQSLKKEAWVKLIKTKKLGYLALLRNLRNIMQDAPEVLDLALTSLTSPEFIKKSLIFPFQYLIAYKQFMALNTKESRKICDALSKAIDISCANVNTLGFEGETLVAVDNSGSMNAPVAKSEHMKCSELGALFGMVFAKAANADIMEFGSYARYIPYSLSNNSMDFAATFHQLNRVGHGTEFNAIFRTAKKKYDRILIFSDMQGWMSGGAPYSSFAEYKKLYKANPHIYSFDLAGYGSMMFPENKTYCIAGFSDKILTIMSMLEKDRNALINEIKKIEL